MIRDYEEKSDDERANAQGSAPIRLEELSDRPLVSVIVSNYNYGRFLNRAVESVFRQTYQNFEIVICDDGSTDESHQVLDELNGTDPRIHVLYKENGGQASAWNHAYRHSSGEIVVFLDPDDAFRPEKLERVLAAFRARPQAGLVYHQFQPARDCQEPMGAIFPKEMESGWLRELAVSRGGWGAGTVSSVLSIRRELADRIFPIPVEFRRGFSDAYIQAVAQFVVEIQSIEEPLTLYGLHDDNLVGSTVPQRSSIGIMAQSRRDVFPKIKTFVAEQCNPDLAESLRLHDIPSYWEYVAAYHVLSGSPREGSFGHPPDEILESISSPKRERAWWLLFNLPSAISTRLLRMWWGQSRLKSFAVTVANRLRLT